MSRFLKIWGGRKETLTNKLDGFIDPALKYSFNAGPSRVRSREEALRVGINCVALAHLALDKLFNYKLPPELHCSELYRDTHYTVAIEESEPWQEGDLLWFGRSDPTLEPEQFEPVYSNGQLVNWREFPIKHIGVHTGREVNEQPLVLHATHYEGTIKSWPLSEFANYKRYARLYGIKRLREEFKAA